MVYKYRVYVSLKAVISNKILPNIVSMIPIIAPIGIAININN